MSLSTVIVALNALLLIKVSLEADFENKKREVLLPWRRCLAPPLDGGAASVGGELAFELLSRREHLFLGVCPFLPCRCALENHGPPPSLSSCPDGSSFAIR